nr:zinc finger protein 829-like [Manis javanica]
MPGCRCGPRGACPVGTGPAPRSATVRCVAEEAGGNRLQGQRSRALRAIECRRGPSLAASTLFQEQQKMHDSQKCVCQVSMSFKDVTVSFTRDEWLQLTGTQRTLYQDVMLENYSHLVFVEAPVSQQLLRSLTSYLPWRVLRHQTRGDLQVGARRALATRGRIPRSS